MNCIRIGFLLMNKKKNNLRNKILKGAEALGFIAMNVLEKRIRLCNDEIQDDGIQKIYLAEIKYMIRY